MGKKNRVLRFYQRRLVRGNGIPVKPYFVMHAHTYKDFILILYIYIYIQSIKKFLYFSMHSKQIYIIQIST